MTMVTMSIGVPQRTTSIVSISMMFALITPLFAAPDDADGGDGSFSLAAAVKQLVLQAPLLSAAAAPSDAVVVKELPRSAAGKLMRGCLPHPDSLKPQTKVDIPEAPTGTLPW